MPEFTSWPELCNPSEDCKWPIDPCKGCPVTRSMDRREFLAKNMPICPACSDVQVQLIDHLSMTEAMWKCRICKHKFFFEPKGTA